MDKSFSLHFNPITDIKTIKEYESELEKLRNENFAIKHELSYYKNGKNEISPDIRKLLEDSHRSIEILEKEKMLVAKKYEGDIKSTKDRVLSMENENRRLLKCIENINDDNEKMRTDNQRLTEFIMQQNGAEESNKAYAERIFHENESLKQEVVRIQSDMRARDEMMARVEAENKKALADLHEKYNVDTSRVDGLRKEKDMLVEHLRKCDSEMSALQESIRNKEAEVTGLESCNRELEAALREREKRGLELRDNADAYKQECDRAMREAEYEKKMRCEREGDVGSLRGQLYEMQEVLKKYEREFEKVKTQTEEKEGLMRKRLQNLSFKENELESFYRREIKKYEDENTELKNQFHSLKSKYQGHISRIGENFARKVEEVRKMKDVALRIGNTLHRMGAVRDNLTKNKENIGNLETQKRKMGEELMALRDEMARGREKHVLSEKCARFLESIGMSKDDSYEKIVAHFSKMYHEMVDRIRVMEKEIGEMTYFAENNKNVLHERTLKLLDSFTKEFSGARIELEECKGYLEKKNKEIKAVKKEKMDFDSKLRLTERKKNELQDVLARMRERYNVTERELRGKNETISKLQTKIDAHFG